MSSSHESQEKNGPIQKIAQGAIEKPGMYLIALRAHLNRGKTIISDVFETVADVLPTPAKLRSSDPS